jgi:hypothetical protein
MSLREHIEDIFSYYCIHISQSGYKTILFLCPFHEKGQHDHNAVIYVKDGGWNCFNPSCDSGGTLLTIVQRMERCSRDDAIDFLKKKFSLDFSELVFDEPDHYQRAKKYFPLPRFYNPIELENPYLKDNQFTWGNLNRLGVGQKTNSPSTLVLPYTEHGRNVGYGVKPLGQRMNFPEGFEVNDHLYCIDQALGHNIVYVGEGNRDAWRLWEHDCPSVGMNNANCSSSQFNLLIRNWRHVVLVLDGDKAGAIGTLKLFRRLHGLVKLEAILLPYQKDPEDIRDRSEFLKLPRTDNEEVVVKYSNRICELQERDEIDRKNNTKAS